jgi:hypothetical protein
MKKWLPLLLLAAGVVGVYFYTRGPSVKVGVTTVDGQELTVVKADPIEIEAA